MWFALTAAVALAVAVLAFAAGIVIEYASRRQP